MKCLSSRRYIFESTAVPLIRGVFFYIYVLIYALYLCATFKTDKSHLYLFSVFKKLHTQKYDTGRNIEKNCRRILSNSNVQCRLESTIRRVHVSGYTKFSRLEYCGFAPIHLAMIVNGGSFSKA